MKPDTWGSTKLDENIYKPSPVPNMNSNNSFYNNTVPPSGPLYSNKTEQNFTSLPNFNLQQIYQVQSPIHSEQSSMSFVPLPSVQTTQVTPQHSMPYQTNSLAQNFGSQPPHMLYNPPPHPPTQSFPQQQFYPSQSVYQPSSQTIPTHQSGLQNPSIYQYQNFSDPYRPIQQSLPPLPAKFDPYRPQPVGAYDIPKPQQTIIPPPTINPQDIYRPGGLLGTNQTQIPSSTIANNSYDQNQYVQYIPSSSPSSSASVSAPFANLSINSTSNH
jgi:hypothetical protein